MEEPFNRVKYEDIIDAKHNTSYIQGEVLQKKTN